MSLRPFARLLPVPLFLLTAACQQRQPDVISSPASMKQLEGTWLSSREENAGDTLVYRPNTYNFPAARGRTGFAIKSFGRFQQFDIAPTDGLTGYPGTWVIDGKNKLRIHLDEGQEPDYDLQVLSLKGNVLKLRKLPAGKP